MVSWNDITESWNVLFDRMMLTVMIGGKLVELGGCRVSSQKTTPGDALSQALQGDTWAWSLNSLLRLSPSSLNEPLLCTYQQKRSDQTKKKNESKLKPKDKGMRKRSIRCPYNDQHKFYRLAPVFGRWAAVCFLSFYFASFAFCVHPDIIIFMLYSE